VRHITPVRLDTIEPLLDEIRAIDGLVERNRGVFYKRSKAFLHFHEDGPRDVYADVRLDGVEFERMRVTTKAEQAQLLRRIRLVLP
jgi:hypothetical protein